MDDKDRDLESRGMEDELKGTAKELGGKIRGDLGDATDNASEHLKGRAQEAEGSIRKHIGRAEQDLGAHDDDEADRA